jgi:hypothetical protein
MRIKGVEIENFRLGRTALESLRAKQPVAHAEKYKKPEASQSNRGERRPDFPGEEALRRGWALPAR